MIDDVRLAFSALATGGAPTDAGLIILPIKSVDGIFVGVDDQSRQHLLLATDSDFDAIPDVATLDVTTRNLVIGRRNVRLLDITCLFAVLAEVFDHFAAAVIERVSVHSEVPVTAVRNVLDGWRNFLIPPTGPPGRDKLTATIGELLLVRDAISAAEANDIGFWVGPFGQRHDMRGGPTAVEVKTTRSHTGYRVTIHGEDQLLPPDGGTLHLHFVRLEMVHGGSTRLSALVDELLSKGVSAQALFSALAANGVPVADLPDTDNVTFEVRERATLPVDDRTPRVIPDSFVGGRRPSGVLDINYVVDLGETMGSSLGDDEYLALITQLASGAT